MKPAYCTDDGSAIVYDADQIDQAGNELFDPSYWESRNAMIGKAIGRATTWFVRHGADEWALRHYYRGGVVAKFVKDSYLWTGLENTRAWLEWRMTADLYTRGLPVPLPVAARVIRHGMSYSADFITRRIPTARSLSLLLTIEPLDARGWQQLGSVIRRVHDAGVDHADLNAHNIMVDDKGDFFIIDFDKGHFRIPGAWRKVNIARLHRSLQKLSVTDGNFYYRDTDWRTLLKGYRLS